MSGLEETDLAGSDGMISPDFLAAAGDAAEGMYHSGPNLAFESELGMHFDGSTHSQVWRGVHLSAFHAHAYDGANMLFDAVEEVAKVGDDGSLLIGRQALRDALFATEGMEGITGTITCDEYGDCADPQIVINQVQDGAYVPISGAAMMEEEMPAGPAMVDGPPEDALGVIKVGPDDPIRIGYALVISGPNETLGVDSRRGIEIAIDDKVEVLGHAIELVGEDALCSAEGGQAAATKLASDPTLIGVIGTNCSSGGEPASAILSDAGTSLVSPSNTAPSLTAPETHQGWLLAHRPQRQGAGQSRGRVRLQRVGRPHSCHDS